MEIYAYKPLYVVNGNIVESIEHIPHDDIERIDNLPANEETIAKWGIEASEGVILVTLRYDQNASFHYGDCHNFTDYLASVVRWDDTMPAERVSLRIEVNSNGKASISEVISSTSKQYLKRVMRAIEEAPLWQPAYKGGVAMCSQHLVNLQLPKSKSIPKEMGIIIR
jgi:hypothetical protein